LIWIDLLKHGSCGYWGLGVLLFLPSAFAACSDGFRGLYGGKLGSTSS
jgi:hypothetical protein